MNITPTTRQVTDFSFTLSSQDLERYLADPQTWANDVLSQLNGHVTSAGHLAPGKGAAPKVAAGAPAHARRHLKRKPKKSSSTHKSKHQSGKVLLKCPECGQPFLTAGRLTNHRRDRHGVAPVLPPAIATAGNAE